MLMFNFTLTLSTQYLTWNFLFPAGPDFHSYAISSSFAKHDPIKGIKPLLSTRSLCPRTQVACQASFASFSFPKLESKPKWWWRTLACVPYLLPLHNMWLHADAIYHLHPYLQRFNLLYAFIDTMAVLPGWLFLVIFMTIYFFVVRRKWSPHFLRFHIILAILLDTGSQALVTSCNWNPSIIFRVNQWLISGWQWPSFRSSQFLSAWGLRFQASMLIFRSYHMLRSSIQILTYSGSWSVQIVFLGGLMSDKEVWTWHCSNFSKICTM
jgi:hypothetical protein